MYATQVTNDLNKMIKTVSHKHQNYIALISTCLKLISTCHKFHMGSLNSIQELCKGIILDGKLFETGLEVGNNSYIKLPYKVCYFDGVADFGGSVGKRAFLSCESEHDPEFINFVPIQYYIKEKLWAVDLSIWVIHVGKSLPTEEFLNRAMIAFPDLARRSKITFIQASNNMSSLMMVTTIMDDDYPFKSLSDDIDFYYEEMTTLHTFLIMLNCKNVSTNKIKADSKLNKKRVKSGKVQLFDYHILKLDLPSLESKESKSLTHEEAMSHYRQHFCRGHVRVYKPDKPLFGKYSGPVWVPSHLRGSEGFIDKDYAVGGCYGKQE